MEKTSSKKENSPFILTCYTVLPSKAITLLLAYKSFTWNTLFKIGSTAPSGWGEKHCDDSLKRIRWSKWNIAMCWLNHRNVFPANFMYIIFIVYAIYNRALTKKWEWSKTKRPTLTFYLYRNILFTAMKLLPNRTRAGKRYCIHPAGLLPSGRWTVRHVP